MSNVRLAVADIQTDDLGTGFDAAYCRFAMMLLADPASGLANVARALKPGGTLGMVTWGPLYDNPWMWVPALAAAPLLDVDLAPPPIDSDPQQLSDPNSIQDALTQAGYATICITEVHGKRRIRTANVRQDVTSLIEEGGPLCDRWDATDSGTRDRCIEAIVDALGPYGDDDGWSVPGVALGVIAHVLA